MKALRRAAAACALAFATLSAGPLYAATAAQMNLEQMVTSSERVFVGVVIDVTESRKAVGGGEVPAVTYTIKVTDAFKGEYEEIKGERYTEVTMLGSLKHLAAGRHPIADFPMLSIGREYLLMVAPAGPIGLTATMGLGQGCFSLTPDEESKVALNGANNMGLFAGMTVGIQDGQPIQYGELASIINDIVGGAE